MKFILSLLSFGWALAAMAAGAAAPPGRDLPNIKADGVLRHLGVPYANFVTGSDDGMDVELIKGFAKYLGVKYEYIKTDWGSVVEDLVGQKVIPTNGHAVLGEEVAVRGDLIANGFTMLPWRMEVLDYSEPTFPSQIWLIARADSAVKPIKPSKNVERDIDQAKRVIKDRDVLALEKTCLDPALYNLAATGARINNYGGNLNEMAPALISKVAEFTILDVPDALIALEKWPGKIKIIGPISAPQTMAVGFPKSSPRLREAFNRYLEETRQNGSYARIIKYYYPTVSYYFPAFF